MPNRHPRVLSVAFALVVGACSGGPAPSFSPDVETGALTTAPTGVAASAPAPTATTSTLETLPARNLECPKLGTGHSANPFTDAQFDVGRFGVEIQVTSASPRWNPAEVIHPEQRPSEPWSGELVGGHEARFHVSYHYDGKVGPNEILSSAVVLRMADGTSQVLPTRLVPYNEHTNEVAVAVPNVSAEGTLELTVDWVDQCFHFIGGGKTGFTIVPTSVTSGCSMDEDQHRRDLDALFEPPLIVHQREVVLFPPFSSAKYLPYDNPGIDFFAVYAWDPDATAIKAAPGSDLEIRSAHPQLHLLTMESYSWTRRSVVEAVMSYPPEGLRQVFHWRASPRANGSFRLRVPDEPGRYVVSVAHGYEWTCGTGTAFAVFSLTVE